MCYCIKDSYHVRIQCVAFEPGVTKELYVWALSVVYSRAIEVTRRRVDPSSNALTFVEDVRVIVPLLDMANHNPEPGAAHPLSSTLLSVTQSHMHTC